MKHWVLCGFLAASLVACGGRADRDPPPQPREPEPEPEPTASAPSDPPPANGLCRSNADCVVAAPCCAACGTLSREEAIPLSRLELEAFRESCAASGEPCAECFRESNPYLVPACVHRLCHVFDLSAPAFTECERAADCTLRANECCGSDSATFIAVSAAALDEIEMQWCGAEPPSTNCRVEPPLHQAAMCRERRCVSAFFQP